MVTAAAAFGLQAIDIVAIDFKDIEALSKETEFGAQLGFTGKQIIHPAQVGAVQAAFTPNDEAIAHAKRIVETFEASKKEGKGAYALDGKMIDMPLLKNAQKVLDRARPRERFRILLLSILLGLTSAITWGAGDFTGGLAARKTGAFRAVFYGEAVGLVLLFAVCLPARNRCQMSSRFYYPSRRARSAPSA